MMRPFFVATSVALALFALFWYAFGDSHFFGMQNAGMGTGTGTGTPTTNAGAIAKRSPEAAPDAAPRKAPPRKAPPRKDPPRKYATLTGDHSPPAATVFPIIPQAAPKPPTYAKLTGDHSPPSPTVFPVVPEAPVVAQTFAKLTADHAPPAPTVVPNTPSLLSDGSADLTPPLGTVFPVKFSVLPDAAPLMFAALTGDHSPPAATVLPKIPEAASATPETTPEKPKAAPATPMTFAALSGDHSPPSPTVFPVVPRSYAALTADHAPPIPTVFPVVPPVEIATTAPAAKAAPETKAVVFPIRFNFAKNTFTPKGRKAADDLLAYITSRKLSSITLSGHTDSRGSDKANLALSKRRLQGVAKHLRAGGYSGDITLQPKGESEPFTGVDRAKYSADQLHEMDRRVELRASN